VELLFYVVFCVCVNLQGGTVYPAGQGAEGDQRKEVLQIGARWHFERIQTVFAGHILSVCARRSNKDSPCVGSYCYRRYFFIYNYVISNNERPVIP